MTLLEIVSRLDTFDEESTIYAAKPWTADAYAIVALETEDLPEEAQELGLKYFLEMFVAHHFLKGWVRNLDAEPTPQEKCMRLIQYANTDA